MKKLALLFALCPFLVNAQWIQIGDDIDGLQANEISGTALSMNGQGNIVLIGASNNSTILEANGQARVFEWNGSNWNPKGDFINGTSNGDNFGFSVDMNSSGDIIIIGAPRTLSATLIEGYAQVFQWSGSAWMQIGETIQGTSNGDYFGSKVSINSDGTIIAISSEPFSTASAVRVFEWNGQNWIQLGEDISSSNVQDGFGRSLSLNASGHTIAISSENFGVENSQIGRVQIFEWNGNSWTQKGEDLEGETELDYFGNGVAISDDGNVVSAGARATLNQSAGYVKVYEWEETSWVQRGSTILGNIADFYGTSTDLNDNGDFIVIGTTLGDYADILQFDGNDWIQVDSLPAENIGDQLGIAVSINDSGSIAAAGARGNDDGGNQAGHVRVYENSSIIHVNEYSSELILETYPNPATNLINVRVPSSSIGQTITLTDALGNELEKRKINNSFLNIDLSNYPSGVYYLHTTNGAQSIAQKFVKQ